jgi:hypothetical protein
VLLPLCPCPPLCLIAPIDGGQDGELQADFPVSLRGRGSCQDMLVLSIGAGQDETTLEYEQTRKWGMAKWAGALLDVSAPPPGYTDTDSRRRASIRGQQPGLMASLPEHTVSFGVCVLDDAGPHEIPTAALVGRMRTESGRLSAGMRFVPFPQSFFAQSSSMPPHGISCIPIGLDNILVPLCQATGVS